MVICYRNKGKIQKLQEREATKEQIINKQNEVIKSQQDEVDRIIMEAQKVKEVVKQREKYTKIQQEIDKKKEETEKQIEYSAENKITGQNERSPRRKVSFN